MFNKLLALLISFFRGILIYVSLCCLGLTVFLLLMVFGGSGTLPDFINTFPKSYVGYLVLAFPVVAALTLFAGTYFCNVFLKYIKAKGSTAVTIIGFFSVNIFLLVKF